MDRLAGEVNGKPQLVPFKVPSFPVVPLVFVLLATLLLVNTVITAPEPSALGLGMTALGGLVFVVFLRGRASRSGAESAE